MKILIGMLYCEENEYFESLESVKLQAHTNNEYFCIKNLPKKMAHELLYTTFMRNSNRFDLFIKLDADMVLCRRDFFNRLENVFHLNPQIDDLEIPVFDYFTDRLIHGLHVYSNRVKWFKTNEKVFTDMGSIIRKIHVPVSFSDSFLTPAAWHCPNPSGLQAFHFGIHKAVKAKKSKLHINNIRFLNNNWKKKKEKNLGFALIGALLAIKENFTHEHIDYYYLKNCGIFNNYQDCDILQLSMHINELVSSNKSSDFNLDLDLRV